MIPRRSFVSLFQILRVFTYHTRYLLLQILTALVVVQSVPCSQAAPSRGKKSTGHHEKDTGVSTACTTYKHFLDPRFFCLSQLTESLRKAIIIERVRVNIAYNWAISLSVGLYPFFLLLIFRFCRLMLRFMIIVTSSSFYEKGDRMNNRIYLHTKLYWSIKGCRVYLPEASSVFYELWCFSNNGRLGRQRKPH